MGEFARAKVERYSVQRLEPEEFENRHVERKRTPSEERRMAKELE